MFTEGLDSNALRWVRHENQKAVAPAAAPPLSIHSLTNNARRFPLPSPSKFRSGHLPPTAIPLSHTLLTDDDSNNDVYGSRYSLDSDEPIPHTLPTSMHQTYANAVPRYATDVSSSIDTLPDRSFLTRSYTDDDDDDDDDDGDDVGSDSVASSEFSTTQPGSSSVSSVLPQTRLRVSQGGYASYSTTSVPSQPTNL